MKVFKLAELMPSATASVRLDRGTVDAFVEERDVRSQDDLGTHGSSCNPTVR